LQKKKYFPYYIFIDSCLSVQQCKFPPRWGDSVVQVSNGKDRRPPTWHQPRDRRVPSPPSRAMHLTQIHCKQSAITPSVPGSGLPSPRWINSMAQSLLCLCVSSSTSAICTMHLIGHLRSFIHLRPSPPVVCALPCCSLASLTFFLCLLALTTPKSCQDIEGNPNAAQLGSQIDCAWLSAPRLHPPTVHHPPRQPPRCSLAIVSTVSRPSPRHMHVGSNGLISWEILWVLTRGQFQTWPPLRSQRQSFLPTLLRFQPMNIRQSIHPQLRMKVSVPTMNINRLSLTPAQTVPLAHKYKKALQFCKARCSN
jgi:hypothetical protein